jgi:hypothetical protein
VSRLASMKKTRVDPMRRARREIGEGTRRPSLVRGSRADDSIERGMGAERVRSMIPLSNADGGAATPECWRSHVVGQDRRRRANVSVHRLQPAEAGCVDRRAARPLERR